MSRALLDAYLLFILKNNIRELSPEAIENTKTVVRELSPERFSYLWGAKRATILKIDSLMDSHIRMSMSDIILK